MMQCLTCYKYPKGYFILEDWEDMTEIFCLSSHEEAKAGLDSVDANNN